MRVVSSESSWQIQVQLIDSLMQKGGASLATRGPNRYQVLLLACEAGSPPEVIDCLLQWNSKRGGKALRWNHCNARKEGLLVLAATSGSMALVSHLLSLVEIDASSYHSDSNSPIKVLDAAIKSGNEQLVLLVLRHERFKDNIQDVNIFYDSDSDGGCYHSHTAITVEDCVREAYDRKLFQAVCEISYLDDCITVQTQIWLCWRKTQVELEAQQNAIIEEASTAQAQGSVLNAQIKAIARKIQGDLVYKHNPNLLPLLVARLRYVNNDTAVSTEDSLAQFIVLLDEGVFRTIVKVFILSPDELKEEVERDIHFQKNAEWCCECEGWYLAWTCHCGDYCGYSS